MRRLFQFAFCLTLAALLAAQQIVQAQEPAGGTAPAETVFAYRVSLNRADPTDSNDSIPESPFETPVELTPVDPAAWANAAVGSALTFRVVRDAVAGQYAYAYAGTFIEAKVIRIRAGKPRIRHGKTQPRVQEVLMGKSTRLDLESSPGGRARLGGFARNMIVWLPHTVVLVFEYILLFIACATGCDL